MTVYFVNKAKLELHLSEFLSLYGLRYHLVTKNYIYDLEAEVRQQPLCFEGQYRLPCAVKVMHLVSGCLTHLEVWSSCQTFNYSSYQSSSSVSPIPGPSMNSPMARRCQLFLQITCLSKLEAVRHRCEVVCSCEFQFALILLYYTSSFSPTAGPTLLQLLYTCCLIFCARYNTKCFITLIPIITL